MRERERELALTEQSHVSLIKGRPSGHTQQPISWHHSHLIMTTLESDITFALDNSINTHTKKALKLQSSQSQTYTSATASNTS